MSRAIALSALRARVRKLADIGPDTTSSSARHPNADINMMINVNWQSLRRKLVQTNGARNLYCKPSTGTLTPGATAPYAWGVLAVPADCAHLVGFEITLSNGKRKSLTPETWSFRNEQFNSFSQQTGEPQKFFVYNMGVESTTTVTPGSIGIVPAPDGAYPYTLWYLPSWTDITTDTFVFDGVEGWDEWVVWACVLDIAAADNDMAGTAQLAAGKLAAIEEDIMRSANAVQRVGPICRQNVAALEERDRLDSRYYLYGNYP